MNIALVRLNHTQTFTGADADLRFAREDGDDDEGGGGDNEEQQTTPPPRLQDNDPNESDMGQSEQEEQEVE